MAEVDLTGPFRALHIRLREIEHRLEELEQIAAMTTDDVSRLEREIRLGRAGL
jgi:hypothetical protein